MLPGLRTGTSPAGLPIIIVERIVECVVERTVEGVVGWVDGSWQPSRFSSLRSAQSASPSQIQLLRMQANSLTHWKYPDGHVDPVPTTKSSDIVCLKLNNGRFLYTKRGLRFQIPVEGEVPEWEGLMTHSGSISSVLSPQSLKPLHLSSFEMQSEFRHLSSWDMHRRPVTAKTQQNFSSNYSHNGERICTDCWPSS